MRSMLNFWTKVLNLKQLSDLNNIYCLNKIKTNSAQLESNILFYIKSLSFLRIKRLNSSLTLGDKIVPLFIFAFLFFIFISSLLLLFWF